MTRVRQSCRTYGVSSGRSLRAAVGSPSPSLRHAVVQSSFDAFHRDRLGILVVGSARSAATRNPDGSWEQAFRFGSLVKPQGGEVTFGDRWIVSIETAAIKCYGTDDDGGEDEPYLVALAYAVDPLEGDTAVLTERIDFPAVTEKAVFGRGHPVTSGIAIPGEGQIRLRVALFDREAFDPVHLEKKWGDVTKAGIIAGLARLHPLAGATALALETSTGVVTDISKALLGAWSDLFGDNKVDDIEYVITTDYLERLITDGNVLSRSSASIPGIAYNFPETPEAGAEGGQWLFSNGDGSYRIFFSVRAAKVTLSAAPH